MLLRPYVVKLAENQVEAVKAAFTDSYPDATLSAKLRILIADGLAARGIEFPPTPAHGGKRRGSGRPKRT